MMFAKVILLLMITPSSAPQKTYKAILKEMKFDLDYPAKIGKHYCYHKIMKSDYDSIRQIAAKKGTIIFYNYLTDESCHNLSWEVLKTRKAILQRFAKKVSSKHDCHFEISVGQISY